jgi:hemoglobin/transferrin/lactoferrin receptor protein
MKIAKWVGQIICGLSIFLAVNINGVGDDKESTKKTEETKEIIVTASRHETKAFEAPYITEIISVNDIQNRNLSRTTPEIFSSNPSTMVQKTSQGQGSPYLRGFTGFRTLFLIDGIRLNNSVFRDGPNEYWNTIDSFTIDRLEIVKGSGSVLYGSDSVGGTVNALTISPKKDGWHSRVYERYASADSSNITRLEISSVINKSFGFIAGGSSKDFNDLSGGRHLGLQPKTGYEEQDYDIKCNYNFTPRDSLVFIAQKVNQPDVWRTHSTTYGITWQDSAIGTDKERSLSHMRQLTYLQYNRDDAGILGDKAKLSFSYHTQNEDQHRLKSDNKIEDQGFDVNTAGFFIQAERKVSFGHLTYGAEYYRDNVSSFMRKYKTNRTLESIGIQGSVADDAKYDLTGVFIQDEYPLNQKLNLTAGARYTQAKVDADKVEDPKTKKQISLSDRWSNVVGNLRLSYLANHDWNIFGGVSQSFRAPNLSDLTRLDIALSNEIETPSPGLKPEKYSTIETGVKNNLGKFASQGALFYTTVQDMIVRYPTGTIISGKNEVQKANIGDGRLYGGELSANYQIDTQWSLLSGVAWQKGEVDTYLSSALVKERKPMSIMPPAMGLLGVKWAEASGKQWIQAEFKGADKQDRLSPLDKLNTQRIPPDGTPGYVIYNMRGGAKLSEIFQLSIAVENITNRDYRIHGSGNNEAGTNFIISLTGGF